MSDEAADAPPHVLGAALAPPQRAKIPRARKSNGQVLLFALLIVVGAAIMASPLPVEAHFASALLLTALYCLFGWARGWHRRPGSGEQFIDSCYYLGFIFTQIALAISFWKAFQSDGQFSANDLVPLVATALGASVIGLIAKVLFDQTVEDVTAIPEHVQRDLAESASAIARETQGVAATFKDLSDQMHNAANNSRIALSGAIDVSALAQSHQHSLQASLSDLSRSVDQLKSEMADSGRSAQQGVRDMVGDLRTAIQTMGELRSISAQISELGLTAQGVLQESSTAFSTANQAGRAFEQRVGESVEQIRTDFAGIADRVEASASNIVQEGVRNVQTDLGQRLEALTQELRRAEQAIADVVQTFDRNLRELTAANRGR